ncbi:DUF1269 domain-containing protein [Saccharothrix violaceirubra]|uniref:Putative membrane protein n=1 Tax=Saccharothrix violaceirubra TaxID=413306 RepID=A0A7W7T4M4_9PSEU|nr:DUF1269 domain-containing protein [Saccharothrix violaceirubra]MBB4966509.1 putative membrane protein [Saccharothrix violaceirubra]
MSADLVTVWLFRNALGAADALDPLPGSWGVRDAAVVSWPLGAPSPLVERPGRIVGDTALGGAFWGLLCGLPLAAPMLCAGVGAGVGALVAWTTRPRLPRAIVDTVRGHVGPGRSALVLSTRGLSDDLLSRLRSSGGTQLPPTHAVQLA